MPYFLGIDGGGSRTTACVADERHILSLVVTGPSNPLKVGFETAQQELLRAARAARRLTRRPLRLDAVCAGVAGVASPWVHRRMLAWLRRTIPARHHLLTSDAAIALHAALGNARGIIVISGTGSIAYGRDEEGNIVRAGGWGIPFDDLGSGYELGRKAISAGLQAFDGRGRCTLLTKKLCRALKLSAITQVVSCPPTVSQIAGLFPLVVQAAGQRDLIARQLCDEAGRNLAEMALAVLKRLRWLRRATPVICAGGVFRASTRIRRSFTRHLQRHAPLARVSILRSAPVEGAIALARKLAASRAQR